VLVTRAVMPSTVQDAPPACGTGGVDHLGVRFVSVQDQVDTNSPMGRAMFNIIGALAELESSLISDCVTAGLRAAEASGLHLGRPGTPPRIVSEITKRARTNQPQGSSPVVKLILNPPLRHRSQIELHRGSACAGCGHSPTLGDEWH